MKYSLCNQLKMKGVFTSSRNLKAAVNYCFVSIKKRGTGEHTCTIVVVYLVVYKVRSVERKKIVVPVGNFQIGPYYINLNVHSHIVCKVVCYIHTCSIRYVNDYYLIVMQVKLHVVHNMCNNQVGTVQNIAIL